MLKPRHLHPPTIRSLRMPDFLMANTLLFGQVAGFIFRMRASISFGRWKLLIPNRVHQSNRICRRILVGHCQKIVLAACLRAVGMAGIWRRICQTKLWMVVTRVREIRYVYALLFVLVYVWCLVRGGEVMYNGL